MPTRTKNLPGVSFLQTKIRNRHFVTKMKYCCYGLLICIRYDNKQDPLLKYINLFGLLNQQARFLKQDFV